MKQSLVGLRRTIMISCGVFLFLMLIAYLCIVQYYKEHFCARTFINGMDCSNLTVEEAKELITAKAASYALCIVTRDGESTRIDGKEIGLCCVFLNDINEELKGQSAYGWLPNALREENLDTPYKISYDRKRLDTIINGLSCNQESRQKEPVNAKISAYAKETGFQIIKEQLGSKIDKRKLKEEITHAVMNLKPTLSLADAGCYESPSITSQDKRLTDALQLINKYMQTKVTYIVGNQTVILDGQIIGPAIRVDAAGQVTLDMPAMESFINGVDEKCHAEFQTRAFRTSYGKTIQIKLSEKEEVIDTQREKEDMLSCIYSGERKNKRLTLAQKEVGDTYVEINLAKQHLFVYHQGKKVIESALVSGRIRGGHTTPTGVYSVQGKQRSRYLEGPDDDGSRYRSYVNYWMPFNGGIGLHDATWRHGRFGGTIYKKRGSHGCINLPLKKAKEIYSIITVGTPVIVYEL